MGSTVPRFVGLGGLEGGFAIKVSVSGGHSLTPCKGCGYPKPKCSNAQVLHCSPGAFTGSDTEAHFTFSLTVTGTPPPPELFFIQMLRMTWQSKEALEIGTVFDIRPPDTAGVTQPGSQGMSREGLMGCDKGWGGGVRPFVNHRPWIESPGWYNDVVPLLPTCTPVILESTTPTTIAIPSGTTILSILSAHKSVPPLDSRAPKGGGGAL